MNRAAETAVVFPALICPKDQLPLDERRGELACPEGHKYAVHNGIPRGVVSAATTYADAFGEQWNRYRTTQLDSYTKTTISRERLKRCLGPALWQKLQGPEVTSVLEAGCGAGRFSEVFLDLPGPVLTSTDLSSAVDANQANCPTSNRHRVIQCDINGFPFRPASYDIVVCLGVIQHTPDPEATIAKLYEQAKPGGWLVIDHYTASFAYYTKVMALLLRPALKRLSPQTGTAATEALVNAFLPLHRAAKGRPLMQRMVSRISPLLTYYHTHPELNDELQREWALLDTHDSLTDYYKHFRTGPQIQSALSKLGASDIWVAKGGNGIEARCRKPLGAGM